MSTMAMLKCLFLNSETFISGGRVVCVSWYHCQAAKMATNSSAMTISR